MPKKTLIIGLMLLLIGSAPYAWVSAQKNKGVRLQVEHRNKLSIYYDELVTGKVDVDSLADASVGKAWQEKLDKNQTQLDKYKEAKGSRELALVISIFCGTAGGALLAWSILMWMAGWLIKASVYLKKTICNALIQYRKAREENRAADD